ncbi:MAG: hypothetical protein ACT4R6_05900 [Gemmatimonadaceae bacterium]
MPRNLNGAALIATALAVALIVERGAAQSSSALNRALELESAGKYRESVVAFREALADAPVTQVILGLERVYYQLGQSDSLLPLLRTLLAGRPRDPTLRTVQLRTLIMQHRDADANATFIEWANSSPRESTPYREYARLLLENNRAAAADTVLRTAARVLGSMQELAAELAQLRAALGLWVASAAAWRDALRTQPHLDQAAVFALLGAPAEKRDSLRGTLRAAPAELGARRLLAALELRWNAPTEAWSALNELAPNESVVAAWVEFAAAAEGMEAWATARDAYQAALTHGAPAEIRLRAAQAAFYGGDFPATVELLLPYGERPDSGVLDIVTALRARAYSALGNAPGVLGLLKRVGAELSPDVREEVGRSVAWAWVRAGQLDSARTAAGADGDDPRVQAWIALYEGDLQGARGKLRQLGDASPDAVLAQALLSRTGTLRSAGAGAAFLALAQRDSVRALAQFIAAATEVGEGAPLMLGTAARIAAARGGVEQAIELWRRIVERHADAPEAAEADLEWARTLRRGGDNAAAIARLEHLLLTYPQSALAPQARRELDLARNAVPPARQ